MRDLRIEKTRRYWRENDGLCAGNSTTVTVAGGFRRTACDPGIDGQGGSVDHADYADNAQEDV